MNGIKIEICTVKFGSVNSHNLHGVFRKDQLFGYILTVKVIEALLLLAAFMLPP